MAADNTGMACSTITTATTGSIGNTGRPDSEGLAGIITELAASAVLSGAGGMFFIIRRRKNLSS